jgi:hypothetical protein
LEEAYNKHDNCVEYFWFRVVPWRINLLTILWPDVAFHDPTDDRQRMRTASGIPQTFELEVVSSRQMIGDCVLCLSPSPRNNAYVRCPKYFRAIITVLFISRRTDNKSK